MVKSKEKIRFSLDREANTVVVRSSERFTAEEAITVLRISCQVAEAELKEKEDPPTETGKWTAYVRMEGRRSVRKADDILSSIYRMIHE